MPLEMKIAVIACAVLEREIALCSQGNSNIVKTVILEQSLHDTPDLLRIKLQETINIIEEIPDIEAIVLAFGLCSRGTEGISTKRCKLVIPRAHDCITLFLGSKERYQEYFDQYPGTYWYTTGWIEHCQMPSRERREERYREYCEKYGEDNAEFLIEEYEREWVANYNRACFIDTTTGNTETAREFTRKSAEFLDWKFDECKGRMDLLVKMLSGEWDEKEFAVLEPGQSITLSTGPEILKIKE